MLDEKRIYEIYELYINEFNEIMDTLNKRNCNDAWIIFESFKELAKNDKEFSVIIRSNVLYDKNDFKIIDKMIVAFTNSNINNVVQGMTYLSNKLLGFTIHRINNKKYQIYVIFNGNVYTSILIEKE